MKDVYQIDMNNQYSRLVSELPKCDIYVSMSYNIECLYIGRDFDYNFEIEDPTGKNDDEFIKVINEIKNKIMKL